MEKAASYIGGAIIAPSYWTHSARKTHATRMINEYLQNITETSLLSSFGKSLESLLPGQDGDDHVNQIFDKFANRNGSDQPVSNEEFFIHFVEAATSGALEDLIPTLWQCFSRAAHFPLNPPYASDSTSEIEIDPEAYLRAFSLLALQGIQLLGFEDYYGTQVPIEYPRKVRRMARFIATCATKRTTAEEPGIKRPVVEDLMESNVKDIIVLTQPPTYQRTFSDEMKVSGVPPNSYPEAADRVISTARNRTKVCLRIRRDELMPLLQLAILVSLQDRRWRNGYMLSKGSSAPDPISADVQYCRLELDEAPKARKLASSLFEWYFHAEGDDMPFHTFASFCADCVSSLR